MATQQPNPGMTRLLSKLIERNTLRSPEVARVMSLVDRAAFVRPFSRHTEHAYEDHPLPIGFGQTISAPHMHVTALELLTKQLRPGARVLDVGSGSGYLCACFGLLVSPGGRVVGVEVVPQLAAGSEEALWQAVPQLMQDGTVAIRAGNVLTGLLASEPPFDAIHVGAAAEQLPAELVAKLAPGGRMVVPVGPHGGYQVLTVVDKQPAEGQAPSREAGREAPSGAAGRKGRRGLCAGEEVLGTKVSRGMEGIEARSGQSEQTDWPAGGIRVTEIMDVGYVPLVG